MCPIGQKSKMKSRFIRYNVTFDVFANHLFVVVGIIYNFAYATAVVSCL